MIIFSQMVKSINKQDFTKPAFFALVIIFIILLTFFIYPDMDEKRVYFPIIAILGITFLALGIILIILARKEKGELRTFLMLTGISATAPFVFSILHNIFYALAITFDKISPLFEALHVISFITSLVIAPILFIIGAVGSIILFSQQNKQ